jgi:carbon monoxide dehydrogenase subunit G
MKNRTSYLLVLVALVSSILACSVNLGNSAGGDTIRGNGNVVTETRDVSNISSIELAMTGTLHITMGDREALTIEAEDNLMGYIQTDVSLGRLVIKTKQGINLQPTRPITYELTVSKLDAITISSDGDIETNNLNSDSFSIVINGSGNLSISSLDCTSLQVKSSSSGDTVIGKLMAGSISVTISSSGNLEIQNGEVQQQNIHISSSGEYHANPLASTSANVTLSSSGSATIQVSDQLSGTLSSSGNVYYIGNPVMNINVTSSGKAIQINP